MLVPFCRAQPPLRSLELPRVAISCKTPVTALNSPLAPPLTVIMHDAGDRTGDHAQPQYPLQRPPVSVCLRQASSTARTQLVPSATSPQTTPAPVQAKHCPLCLGPRGTPGRRLGDRDAHRRHLSARRQRGSPVVEARHVGGLGQVLRPLAVAARQQRSMHTLAYPS
ncbi:hypothetical protein AURDEDRAFT_163790 [Auricularia subglabra TFB-10046 SS5]|nr:hypothetical protein AURDEDRAFT_163790 [Auricularia subglabra TFB-10046 SS5]